MKDEEKTLLEISAAIHQLPPSERLLVESVARALRLMLKADMKHVSLAIALVGAELAAES